ncbi:hypothetical protein [Nonomuraea sp. SYSU D8015]|uniref:hypothetical protein n=1 Tax=Nonomuraea sp. SYSU D8015 TaxID=2593644 RepID=UPI0016602E96|nr:hypothetical protein [Nonomuraea sp. SYSU D8015]
MVELLGTIGSLVVVLLLVVLAILVISVIVLVTLAALAGSMTDWRRLWRRLAPRQERLTVKLSGSGVPERRQGELSGSTPRLRRRLRLGGAVSGEGSREGARERLRLGGAPRRPGRGGRPVERHSRL